MTLEKLTMFISKFLVNLVTGFEKLKQLRKLEKLDLSGNLFNRSIFLSLSQLSSLKSLNLKNNNIGSGANIYMVPSIRPYGLLVNLQKNVCVCVFVRV